eukprot:scaffold888_cov569-Prasinococcus_capsulatus_cf.AAC.23
MLANRRAVHAFVRYVEGAPPWRRGAGRGGQRKGRSPRPAAAPCLPACLPACVGAGKARNLPGGSSRRASKANTPRCQGGSLRGRPCRGQELADTPAAVLH